MSLLLKESYAVECKDDIPASSEAVPNRATVIDEGMMRLAQLAGKVLDITTNDATPSHSEMLAIDLELNHFGSLIPLESWETNTQSNSPKKFGLKAIEESMKQFLYLQIKLVLHLPWMLKSFTDPHFTYSRSSCLEAARRLLQMFQLIPKTDISGPAAKQRWAPPNLHAYAGAVVVILGQMGSVFGTEDPQQLQRDEALVNYTIETFRTTPVKVAEQSAAILTQLVQLRVRQNCGESLPSTLTIPLIGKVTIPKILYTISPLQELSSLSSSPSQMVMHSTWSTMTLPDPIVINELRDQNSIYDSQCPTYVPSSTNDLQVSSSNLQYSNHSLQHASNNLLYSKNTPQFSNDDIQYPGYDLCYQNYDFQYPPGSNLQWQ
jgi:hypothetical protein